MGRKVLVVEDSAAMRGLIYATIESMGDFEVRQAGNGFEALKLLPREQFDLIITDINMPDINGLELVNFIKKNPQYTTTPLFIISTEGSERDRNKGMALGANEYIVKPFDPENLKNLVNKYIGAGGQ